MMVIFSSDVLKSDPDVLEPATNTNGEKSIYWGTVRLLNIDY